MSMPSRPSGLEDIGPCNPLQPGLRWSATEFVNSRRAEMAISYTVVIIHGGWNYWQATLGPAIVRYPDQRITDPSTRGSRRSVLGQCVRGRGHRDRMPLQTMGPFWFCVLRVLGLERTSAKRTRPDEMGGGRTGAASASFPAQALASNAQRPTNARPQRAPS